MAKIESLLKKEESNNQYDIQARTIQFPDYVWAAVFSPVALEEKRRFKSLLKKKFNYTDGKTPQEIH